MERFLRYSYLFSLAHCSGLSFLGLEEGLRVCEKKGFPTKKDESWKYTSLNALINADYALFPRSEASIELKDVKKYFLYDSLSK